MKRFLTAASGMALRCSVLAVAPVSATQPASIPTQATLTEMTEVYNTPDFSQPPAAVLTPQVVKIDHSAIFIRTVMLLISMAVCFYAADLIIP